MSGCLLNRGSNQPKSRNLGFIGLYYFVIEPVINNRVWFLVFEIVSARSLQPLFTSLRYLRYLLCHDSYCSVCGRKVRDYWLPIIEYYIDANLDETATPFDPVYIGCKYCDPFFKAKAIYGDYIIEEGGKKIEDWRR